MNQDPDTGGAHEIRGLLNVTGLAGAEPTLSVRALHSEDGKDWTDLPGLTFDPVTRPEVQTKQVAGGAFRHLRFEVELSGGLDATAAFEVVFWVRPRG